MSVEVNELIGIIRKNLDILERMASSLGELYKKELPLIGRTDRSALMVAGLLENYYTRAETTFLRISQFFENNLDNEHWHRDLLEKMTLEIEGVRIPAVSQPNYSRLLELLKFRHFKRYYFEMEYDWDRLEFIKKKLEQAHPLLTSDLENFIDFLRAI
ncbi:MAG TPA: hypothetical protein ENN41_08750 [Sediminispirochaeta sp.]|nr:hypothetical protein [Sediminispirochaeta sp.]